MLQRCLILASLLVVAACGKTPEKTDTAEAEQPAANPPAVEQVRIKPGQWTSTTELVSMEVAGVDPALLKGNVGKKTEITSCVTPEQAERPAAEFFANPEVKDGRCKSEKFEMADGKMSAVVSCQPGEGQPGATRMEMTGTYAADTYDTVVTVTGNGGPNGGAMKMVAKSAGRHVEDSCKG